MTEIEVQLGQVQTQKAVIPAQAGILCGKKRSRGFVPARE